VNSVQRRDEEARLTHEVASRAIRRLDIFEWVLLGGIAVLASVGGFLVALLLSTPLGFAFRPTWVVASVLLFGVPGVIALRRMRRDEREMRARVEQLLKENDG
jgi:uncharacterized membrane protein